MNKRITSAQLLLVLLATLLACFSYSSPVALALSPGDVDLGFDAGNISLQFGFSSVNVVALQPDGRILIAGSFDHINGLERQGLARLNFDGSLDTTFLPPLLQPGVSAIAVQQDGKILIGGALSLAPIGLSRMIVRLNPDGSVDTSFNLPPSAIQCGDVVNAIALEPDGKIVIGGFICYIGNTQVNGLARLNSDGSLATALGSWITTSVIIKSVALQTDGKIVIGGDFSFTANPVIRNVARLNSAGTLDSSFNTSGTNPFTTVNAVAVQPDGKILAAGSFTSMGGVPRPGLARLNTDGASDTAFAPNIIASQTILAMVLQTDGKILIGGVFGSPLIAGSRRGISRLNSDGTDDSFYPPGGADNAVKAIARQADGRVLIGGDFSIVGGVARLRLARLLDASPPPPATVEFNSPNYSIAENGGVTTITVIRSGNTATAVAVDYATSNGTATEGQDYVNSSGTLTFAPGETTKTFNVVINDDAFDEPDETVSLTLSNPSGATLGTFTALLTILDDDVGPPPVADYRVIRFLIAGGGTRSTGGSYTVTGTVGQHDASVSSAGLYQVEGGFWPR